MEEKKTYTTKHGLKLNQGEMGNTHFDIMCRMADKDPDFAENMLAGRYLPRVNGIRTVYRGKDAKLGRKIALMNFLLDPFMIFLYIMLLLTLLLSLIK